MGRFQQVAGAFALAVSAAIGGGCVNHHPLVQTGPEAAKARLDPGVQQASAKVPAAVPTATIASLSKFVAGEQPKGVASELVVAWQSRVAQLPDPTRNGEPIHGVVGQMFLMGSDLKPVAANGTLVVEMLDATPRPTGAGERLGTWTFDKDMLKKMQTMDERFGKCYTIFLVWPHYDPSVSRVKLKVRFDPEKGYPLFTKESPLTFDSSLAESIHRTQTAGPSGMQTAGFGGLHMNPLPPRNLPPLDPLPVGGRNAQNVPANLPPLVITPQR